MKFKAIIFDLDGTILYTIKTIRNAINYAFTNNRYNKQTITDINNALGKGGINLLKQLLPNNIPTNKFNNIYQDYKSYYLLNPLKGSSPYPQIKSTLKKLVKAGYCLALISNKEDELTQRIVNHFFPNLFSFVTGAKTNCPIKPDPYFVNCFLTNNNFKSSDALYIGDSDVDFLTAKNSNTNFLAVTYGYRSKQDLTQMGQTEFIDKPIEILKYLTLK